MKKLSKSMPSALRDMGGKDADAARIARRTAAVQQMWAEAVGAMWRNPDAAGMILSHTNVVGIVEEENHRGERYKKLFVYVDDSIVLTELNALRERIKLLFLTKFQEDVQEFDIRIARGNRKKDHPYKEEEPPHYIDTTRAVPLSNAELADVESRVSAIENETLKQSLRKAMIADLQWKKGKTDKNDN
ncbi:DUF721 domain-containing protein [Raoultibacter phocaeensis]|uniref:DUF721 domain-containing protein n=1 Tax=Raoultibacter phocaeensis TaxID=2479841 RepID=UPI0011198D76|nr:DUF721 domain-containing protein [Raoultibacter phocaeensis]